MLITKTCLVADGRGSVLKLGVFSLLSGCGPRNTNTLASPSIYWWLLGSDHYAPVCIPLYVLLLSAAFLCMTMVDGSTSALPSTTSGPKKKKKYSQHALHFHSPLYRWASRHHRGVTVLGCSLLHWSVIDLMAGILDAWSCRWARGGGWSFVKDRKPPSSITVCSSIVTITQSSIQISTS